MSLYKKLKYSLAQLKKLAKARDSLWPPPISFNLMGKYSQPKDASDKDDKKDAARYVKFEVPLNNADPNSNKYERKVKIFDDGTPFEWCEFRETTDDLFVAFGCQGATDAHANQRHYFYAALFAGRAKVAYTHNYNHYHAANNALPEDERGSDDHILKLVINETAKSFFDSWDNAVREQQQYMRQNLFIGDMKPSVFIKRLKRMNRFLAYFPRANVFEETNVVISEEQLITIVHHASHGIMQLQLQRANRSVTDFDTLDELKVFFNNQHDCDRLEERILQLEEPESSDDEGNGKKKKKNRKRKSKNSGKDNENKSKESGKKKNGSRSKCSHCGKFGHRDDDCWTLAKNEKKRPANFQSANAMVAKKAKTAKKDSTQALFTSEQVSAMMKTVMASLKEKYGSNEKRGKRQVQFEPDVDDEDNSVTSNKSVGSYFLVSSTYLFDKTRTMEAPSKKQKVAHYSADMIVEIIDAKNNVVPIRALLDTGTSETIILKPFVAPNCPKGYKGSPVTWKTLGGNFITHRRAKIQFAFPELSDKKTVTWVVHVDQHTNPKDALYDMIIGMDCMCELGIYVNTDEKVITWEGNSIPLKERGQLQDKELLNYLYSISTDTSEVLAEAEGRQSRILDANYERVDPDEFVRDLTHLSVTEQKELSLLLKKYPVLFGGGLGRTIKN
jgi:hypothetical protein